MSTALQFILGLAIILAVAKLAAWASIRLGQPAVLGEIVAGLVLGPSVFNLFGRGPFTDPGLGETIQLVGEIGVLLLMFMAGLEINLDDMLKLGRVAALTGACGVILPVAAGLIAVAFGYATTPAVLFGIVMAATSVSISAQTLLELGQLRSRAGLTLLGAAVIDDVLVILVLSVFLALAGGGDGGLLPIVLVMARMSLFLGAGGALAFWLLPRVLRWADSLPVSESLISAVIVSVLLAAWAAEELGAVAAITGAFLAGMAIRRSRLRYKIDTGIHAIAYGLFVPVFLVGIGLHAHAEQLAWSDVPLVLAMVLAAIVSKLIGAGTGARLGGLDTRTALQVGAGMISRGEVGLIVATAGLRAGLLDEKLFALAVIVVVAATLVTPPALRYLFSAEKMTNA